MARFNGSGQAPTLKGVVSNVYNLTSGQVQTLSPAGDYWVRTGPYTVIQQFDPITGIWRTIGGGVQAGGVEYIYSDGVNYRIANQTGCPVGALLTNAGSGYTSAPAVAASAGSSIWRAIIGGAVNTTVTVSNAGANYTYPPIVQISAPPTVAQNGIGGVQATGYATLSGGTVSTIVITDQGAGYTTPPTITLVNDPREGLNNVTAGYNAAAVCTLTGANTVTAVLCVDHGSGGQTTVPTLSFSGGGGAGAAATALMNWSITAFAVSTAGSGISGANAQITALDVFPTTASAYTNPTTQFGLVRTRPANIIATVTGTAITTTTPRYIDGGIYTTAPVAIVVANASVVTTAPVVTVTMGGQQDRVYVQQL